MATSPAVVVVGAGQAGFQVAASLREEGYDGRVTLVGEESGLPYGRPPLSKGYLAGKLGAGHVQLRPARFYEDQRIELRAGARVTAISRAGRTILLASGERLEYSHLVLATGARNRSLPVAGSGMDGVIQLRSLPEADTVRETFSSARRAVVVGGGFIGLEFAAVAAERGLAVTVVEAGRRVMSRAVSPLVSDAFQKAHEARGIRFVLEATVVEVSGENGRVDGVVTADGRRHPADLVLVGIGVLPNTALAAEAGLPTADGILVDGQLCTPDPAISAVGDCAAFPCRWADGGVTRLEAVQNAVDQARCVAARLAGRPAPYNALPWFWSEQGPLKLQIAGLTAPDDVSIARGNVGEDRFSVFRFRAGALAGVESVNRPLDHMAARKLLADRVNLTPEQAADPAFDLKAHANAGPTGR